jgi:proline dehydrogenase
MTGNGWLARGGLRDPLLRRASCAYIAGGRLDDALDGCRRLAGGGRGSTVCYWNANGEDPFQIARAYETIIDAVGGECLDAELAVKPWALEPAPRLVPEVLERARDAGVPVQFDSRDLPSAAPGLALASEVSAALGVAVGVTLPGRWRRSVRDAGIAADQGLRVRVIKGQWPDPEQPKADLRSGFLSVVNRLAGRATRVTVATHDERLARRALSTLRAAGTPCELELLYGLAVAGPLRAARAANVPVRMYVPYGKPMPPYILSRRAARGDPRMLLWLSQDAILGRAKGRRSVARLSA